MTAVLVRPDSPSAWSSMPGWDVVADMTPPELINLRWLGVLRRRIAAGLAVVVVLCAVAYGYAFVQNGKADDAASAAEFETGNLSRAASSYAGITQIETTVDSIRSQVATLMADDVDVANLIGKVRAALPNTMSIENLSVTLAPIGNPSTGLDATGRTEVGALTISGSGQNLNDLPAYVDALSRVPGIVNVLPTSNEVAAGVAQFSVTASLTDQIYSHRYDLTNTGGN